MESDFKIAVIGLGIIGGSIAYALKGFKDAYIVGCDKNPKTRQSALKRGAVKEVFENPAEAMENADLIILCTFPKSIPNIVRENKGAIKNGAVVTDICGVKTEISKAISDSLPRGVDYVGGHPMAGKEVGGFDNAEPDLFQDTGFIIIPSETTKRESVDLIYEMAKYMGATRITMASPNEHDSVIAYTSDLMHVAASALCLDYPKEMNNAYTAGAFRDCTRVARIDPKLWTELFMANGHHTVREIDRFIESLTKIRNAIANRDEETLENLLDTVNKNKIIMLSKEPEEF
ncbi:MAG: prephenate dehydrogenase/arogenate dehydrogenase family protein [Clostridia bacterium]|nr:prephenate dehydrogenase/arogenate dehydrogenase family protein [Clostridia bacterium]